MNNYLENSFKYVIMPGNNSEVVRRCMQTRHPDWEEIASYSKIFNFKWKPFSHNIRFDQLSLYGQRQLVNHIVNHEELTVKDNLFRNMSRYCNENDLNVFDYMPLTFVLEYQNHEDEYKTNSFGVQFLDKADKMCENLSIFNKLFHKCSDIGNNSSDYQEEISLNSDRPI